MDISPAKQAIDRFFTRLGVLFRAKATLVLKADNALKWMSQNKAAVIANVKAGSTDHISNRANVHQVTPAQVNAYSKAELDTMLTGRVPVGVLPISRYGALNFLPVGVSGSYEGAIAPTDNLHVAMNIEDDGTLVMLRAGTDGGTKGIYYSYVLDPLNQAVQMAIRVTSRRYAPAFLAGAGRYADMLFRSNRDVIFGRSNNASGDVAVFLAMAGGTFDDSAHIGAHIPTNMLPAEWFDVDSGYNCSRVDVTYLAGRIYFLNPRGSNADGASISVYSIAESQVRAGNITEVRTETDWDVTDLYGTRRTNQPTIRMTQVGTSADASKLPLIQWETPDSSTISITMIRSPANRAGIHGAMEDGVYHANYENQFQFNWNPPGQASRSTWNVWVWTFKIDFINKKVSPIEVLGQTSPPVAPMKVTTNGANIVFSGPLNARVRGSVSDRGTDYLFTYERQANGTVVPCYMLSQMNWWGSYSHQLVRRKFAGTAKISALLDPTQDTPQSSSLSVSFSPQFGGAFGRRFGAPIFLGNNKVMVHCEGNSLTGRWQEHMAYGDVGYETSFTYPSLDFGTLQGSIPRAYRLELGELRVGLSELTYMMMTETKLSNLNQFTVDQVSLVHGQRNLIYRGINSDLTYTHTLAITEAFFDSVRAQMKAKVIAAFNPPLTANEADFTVEWMIPRTGPAMVAATYLQDNARVSTAMILAEPNTKNGTITGITWDDASLINVATDSNVTGISMNLSTQRRAGAMAMIESDNYWFLSGHGGRHVQRNGSSGYPTWRWALNKATRKFEKVGVSVSDVSNGVSKRVFIPGKGMCITRCNSGYDSFSKVTYTIEGDTEAELYNLTTKNPTNLVLLSMLKPAQWNVSFTEPTDVILSGRKYVLEPVTIFLNEIDPAPANKTFYVYVRLVAGQLQYVIQLAEVPESAINMFIGTIVTGASSITSLNINKVTRIGNYRPSATAIGSGISVSGGAPQDIVPLNWN
ncbi:minor tail protein [Xanthomonas phage Xoo-sp14]|nr:minor tail protein [Xanthomonas phage Xoo-sp14]